MIAHGMIALEIQPDLGLQVYFTSPSNAPSLRRLAHGQAEFIRADGRGWSMLPGNFQLSGPQLAETPCGEAERYTAAADFACGADHLRQELSIDRYAAWPDSLVLHWQFENLGPRSIQFQRLRSPAITLDRDWASSSLWTMQGAAVEWGQDFAFRMPHSFERANYLGHNDGDEGGGLPLVDFWSAQAGLALAHIEPDQRLWYMPVNSARPGEVRLALEDRQPHALAPGQRLDSLRVLLTAHLGDFFAPLARYREALAVQGLPPATPCLEAYQPSWCSWGYEFDVSPEEILGVLPVLKDLHIHWLTVDDRWFDHYSDWNPRLDTFPGGAAQMRSIVEQIHAAGAYAQLWWYPLAVEDGQGSWDSYKYGYSSILQEHPDWLCLNADGSAARNNRGLAILCPALPQVQELIRQQTLRFIREWGFDGHKLDNIYTVPPCYNPAHQHAHPEDSLAAFPNIYRIIFETTRQLKPYAVTQICPCGTPPTHTLLPYMNQAVTADPLDSAQVRQRIKFFKALLGPQAAVCADHVELSDAGDDFASCYGAGGVLATKFTWPEDGRHVSRLKEDWRLSPAMVADWKAWFERSAADPLAAGETLNLYDIGFDVPEGHVTRLGRRLVYAFFTPQSDQYFAGQIELRGLGPEMYQVSDLLQNRLIGTIDGMRPAEGGGPALPVEFRGALLLEVLPVTPGAPGSEQLALPANQNRSEACGRN